MEPGTRIDDRYLIDRLAGCGGMGTVYRALDERTGSPVAIKVLRGGQDPQEGQRFAREARVLSELSHPGVVGYRGHGTLRDGQQYLVLEWIEGETLTHRLERVGFTTAEAVALGRGIAEVLAEAHRGGIVHRDIKPNNVFLSGGEVKVIDFGIARRTGGDDKLTRTGMAIGTPGYMAPEQVRGARDLDARADVFALGCLLYECLTGHAAFSGDSPLALLAKILVAEPEPLATHCPEAPLALAETVAHMLAKEPADRFADGGAVARALSAVGPIAEGPRRPLSPLVRVPALPSTEHLAPPPRLGAVILAGGPTEGDPEWRRALLAEVVGPFRARLEFLLDGSVLAVLEGEAPHLAMRAARCALELRKELGGTPMSLSVAPTTTTASPSLILDEVLERGARVLADAAMAALFDGVIVDVPKGAIRIDATTASLLDPRFVVRRVGPAHYLLGEEPCYR